LEEVPGISVSQVMDRAQAETLAETLAVQEELEQTQRPDLVVAEGVRRVDWLIPYFAD
jgi:hypothetical protein